MYPEKRHGKSLPGKWRVVLWRHGRRQSWVVEGTRREAEDFEARKRCELASGGSRVETRTAPSFSDFCLRVYAPHALAHLAPQTWTRKRRYQVATLIEHFGPTKLDAIDAAAVEQFKAERLREVAPPTVNSDLTALAAVLRVASDLGYPVSRPALRKLPERGRRRAQGWSSPELARLFVEVEAVSHRLLPIVVCLANTGMRKGEAMALRREDVDLARDQIRIWPNAEWRPKDNEPREVPIGDALRPWLERATGVWVFPSSRGSRYATWPQKQFDRARERAGLRGGPHMLRHTFASHFLAARADLPLLARILGHSHERVTELYAHLLPEHLAAGRNVVDFRPGLSAAEWVARQRWKER